jgi:hypothetical protein
VLLRHPSEQEAFETLEQAMPHRDKIIGIGLIPVKWATLPEIRPGLPQAANWGFTWLPTLGRRPARLCVDGAGRAHRSNVGPRRSSARTLC